MSLELFPLCKICLDTNEMYLLVRCRRKDVKIMFTSNISKTSARVSSGVPNTEKQMKARGRRPSTFTVSRCLEPLMKHEARVFGIAS